MAELGKDEPLLMRNAVPRLPSVDRSKFKWSINVGLGVDKADPLAEWLKSFSDGVGDRLRRRTDQVRSVVPIWVSNLQLGVVLETVPLIDGVVALIRRVTSIEFDKKLAVFENVRVIAQREL